MTSLRRLTIVFVLTLAVVLTGCGGSTSVSLGNPGGSFTNANLNGTYAFSVRGQNTFGFFAIAGSFQANGAGNLVSGVMDINSGGTGGIRPNVPFTGTYSVRGNGQGTATLVASFQNFTLDFVIISSQRALLIRFDSNATASGSIDLQSSAAFSNAALGGGFVFNLAGVDAGGNTAAIIGAIATDGAGTITSGVQDVNDNGTPTANLSLEGSYSVASNGRGTMFLNGGIGPLNFTFYVVDGNRLKLVEMDGSPAFAGDAVRQVSTPSNTSLSGSFAYTLSGFDSGGLPLAVGGIFTADGTGNITSGTQDVNEGGTVTSSNGGGFYSIAANGRGTATIGTLNGDENFVIYPTVNGVQIMGIDASEITFGSALAQQGTCFFQLLCAGTLRHESDRLYFGRRD